MIEMMMKAVMLKAMSFSCGADALARVVGSASVAGA